MKGPDEATSGIFLAPSSIGQVFNWDEVSEVHRSRIGIYQSRGLLVSLLTDFGRINPCYPDVHGESNNIIHYTGYGRRGDQKLDVHNRALIEAAQTQIPVPLFNKLAVNRWEFLGFWRVSEPRYVFDESQNRMVWKFTLQKV
ncbi:MAG TPA: hypothetical protein PLD38_06645 [Pyrinomonadaceae bacterium]|jgi:hypothetical protein|nr:hypothetical protein [Chloracidobacterium sp.]MBP9108030.1 hypothetical protein [Pyrinomonadaceae bacterium]MBK9437874.1 hypothetical protein [Chloracidobacterium sp.]MBK9765704.1 hypothetical protein [Chloracidobacterium sp.]MBL0242286.1 hypothetical protein [Chloracidobacterium sp.]